MAKMSRPSDDDFEVVEDIVDDFDYFYEDEEEVVRNAKIIRKLKIYSGLIIGAVLFLIVLFTGIVQMQIYNTSDIVTKDLITKTDYLGQTEELYDYAINFYMEKTIDNKLITSGTYVDIYDALQNENYLNIEEDYLTPILSYCDEVLGTKENGILYSVTVPKDNDFKIYHVELVEIYGNIKSICQSISDSIEVTLNSQNSSGSVVPPDLSAYLNIQSRLITSYYKIHQRS